MGGFFGVISKSDCVRDLFYGTDYHSHLGTKRGGMAVMRGKDFSRSIHNIENTQFRSKFEDDLGKMMGSNKGIGCISDTDDQPLIIGSHLGNFAIGTVGNINNISELVNEEYTNCSTHFVEMSSGEINPSELIATLISKGSNFEEGISTTLKAIDGSCSLLLLTEEGIYAARDFYGRTPVVIGEKEGSFCITIESCTFPNLMYKDKYELGPGEIVLLTPDGIEQKKPPGNNLRICAFMWIYYGYPASNYEGLNVESTRYKCGAALARKDNAEVDIVAGIPDSGIAHAIGYSTEAQIPYSRPFVKYTPTWPRSFMPQNQNMRDLVARMKLIPISELIKDKRLLFCEDSIVRGTQLKETIKRIFDYGAKEVHMRAACPPLIYSCKFLNFSRSKSELDLAARRAISEIEGRDDARLEEYTDPTTKKYSSMVDQIRKDLNLSTLRYQELPDMVNAIGLPKEKLCTYCWDGNG
jgi:amidophosphoribosyltransferase